MSWWWPVSTEWPSPHRTVVSDQSVHKTTCSGHSVSHNLMRPSNHSECDNRGTVGKIIAYLTHMRYSKIALFTWSCWQLECFSSHWAAGLHHSAGVWVCGRSCDAHHYYITVHTLGRREWCLSYWRTGYTNTLYNGQTRITNLHWIFHFTRGHFNRKVQKEGDVTNCEVIGKRPSSRPRTTSFQP